MTGLLQNIAFISMPGGGEWIVILVIGLLIFGRKLPEVARNLGKSVNEFKKGIREFQDSADDVVRDVNKVTNEVASDAKDAAGMNDYGYQDPNASSDYTSQYDSTASDPYGASEPTATTSDVVEPGVSETEEPLAKKDEQDPYVEPTA
jgi:sec-independent protein translocase protein TatA